MAEIVVSAAPGDEARAAAMAEALAALGFEAALTPGDAEAPKAIEEAKCVLALWSPSAATAPMLAVQATLAMQGAKLVCAEFADDCVPALFQSAPTTNLAVRDRLAFKERFEALVEQIEKLTPTEGDGDALPEALIKARSALNNGAEEPQPPQERKPFQWKGLAGVAAMVAVLFALGVGASRLVSFLRDQPMLVAHTPSAAAAEAIPVGPARAAATVQRASVAGYGLTEADLERLSWRDAAAKIRPGQAERIKADAQNGDAFAQTVACIGHMAGAQGFLPSPTAASEYCNDASGQNQRAALYLSWVLRRTTPHAAIDEGTARDRLAEAARRGLTVAQVDYALLLAPDARAPMQAQEEAGRMLLAAAEHGDARGQYNYAKWLRDSPAGPRDPSVAVPYLQRAADANDPEAQHMLATLYRDGIGVPRDDARARALYERAAARNFAPSMFNLADLVRASDRARAADLYRRLACMRDEHQISVMAVRRLHALGEAARCS